MLFSLEVLQAKHGDCLILHYGSADKPKLIVIDGGPSGVYTNYLKPRLIKIKEQISDRKSLSLEMVMVSHADDDHINGIKMMTNEMVAEIDNNVAEDNRMFLIKKLWFNAFDDIVGNVEIPVVASLSSDVTLSSLESLADSLLNEEDEHFAALIASTGQGRTIRNNAETLGLVLNAGFTKLNEGKAKLVRGDQGDSWIDVSGLKIKVVHPNEQRLQELQVEWDKDLKKYSKKGDRSIILSSLTDTDKSPFNLSSIVCVVEFEGKRILLTGDGRSDDILEGLAANGFLDVNGKVHFDVVKMPHHGSIANMTAKFLQAVTADHYVFSADGKHDNPDQETLDLVAGQVTHGTLHFTNHDGGGGLRTKMDGFESRLQVNKVGVVVSYPGDGVNSSVINLLEALRY